MKFRHLARIFRGCRRGVEFHPCSRSFKRFSAAVQQAIHDLEGELGMEFYERQRKGITLTPAGKSFLIDARRILENCEASIRKAQRISRGRDWGIGHWLYVGAVARFFG
jgi:hypothetical protein